VNVRLTDDDGAVAVIVAVSLTMIFALAALAIDVGYWYDTRHQLQAAADAGALAGCSVLIESADPGAAQAAARDYAQRNANGAGVNLTVDDVVVDSGAEPWSVKVIVGRAVPAWFSRVIGGSARTVHADAKAQKTPLTGARYLVPWGIPIIRDADLDRVEARLVDSSGSTVSGPIVLSGAGARTWQGSLSAPAASGGYDVRVNAYNVYGVVEWVGDSKGEQPASRVMVDSSEYPFSAISLDDDYAASDDSPAIRVRVRTKEAQPKVWLKVGKKSKVLMSGSDTSWSYTITDADISFDDGFLETYPLDVFVGNSADGLVDAYVHVRRSTYPFESSESDPGVVSPGGAVNISVTFNEFDPTSLVEGQLYTLRVGSDGVETGNFGELNFGGIQHNTGHNLAACPPDPAGVPLGNNVRDWVESGYGGGVHIGDILPLSPGKSGWVPRVVEDRIAEYGDIVIVPVVAKYQQKAGGAYDVIVRAFAAMRIVEFGSSGGSKGLVEAEFIEYVATPSSYGTPGSGSGGSTTYAARLVNP